MTLKKYLTLMSIIAVVCWVSFAAVVFYINPQEAGTVGYFLFYGSLFIATVATLSVFGFVLRSRVLRGELAFRQVAVTFRQAVWFGVLVVGALWLQARGLLTWWNLILFILVLTILEFFFLSMKRRKRTMPDSPSAEDAYGSRE